MRRMYSENQLIELIQKYGGDIEKIREELVGSFVRIMDAPKSTTLTDEQVEIMEGGVFINGSFAGYKNPVIFPWILHTPNVRKNGLLIGVTGDGLVEIRPYSINAVKYFELGSVMLGFNWYNETLTIKHKAFPSYPANSDIGQLICRKGVLQWYIPVAQDNITSGDTIALVSDLGKALIDHLEVEINGFRARYEYTSGNYVVYSSKTEVDSGAKLQVNMISYNTTNGTLAFNQMTFTPNN